MIYRSFLRGASGTGGGLDEWAEQILSSLVFFCKHISYCQSSLAFQFVCVRASKGGLYSEIQGPSGVLGGDPKVSIVKKLSANTLGGNNSVSLCCFSECHGPMLATSLISWCPIIALILAHFPQG